MSARFLVADNPAGGHLFAAYDPETHHCSGAVSSIRLGASINTFRFATDARAALERAGGRDVREDKR